MSGEKILILILAISFTQALTCPNYQCKTLANLQCIEYASATLTYYSYPCKTSAAPYCPITSGASSTCTAAPVTPSSKSYPGIKCSVGSDCYSGMCTNGYCQGLAQGSPCSAGVSQNVQCNPGLFCNIGSTVPTCLSLFQVNEQCTSDYECTYGTGCYNQATCKQLGSISSGGSVAASECINSMSKYCESEQCHVFTSNNTAICVDRFKNSHSIPYKCTTSANCVSNTNSKTNSYLNGTCSCGNNANGYAYCSLFPGDGYYSKYLNKLEEFDMSSSITKCNIDVAYHSSCMNSHWDKSDLYEYQYYYYMYQYYTNLYDAEECTIKVFYPSYYGYKSNYDDAESSSFAALLKTLGLIYLVS